MKITFLGSSHGVPAPDRYCSALMVEVGDKVYFVDAGAPLIDLLLRKGKTMSDVKAIFTTHAHGDHVDGLLQFIDLLDWYYKEDSVEIYMTEQKLTDAFIGVLDAIHPNPRRSERIRFALIDPDVVYDDGALRVTFIPTKHIAGGARPSYAMLLEAEGKRVLVTGDLSQQLKMEDFPALASESETDVIICEMAHFGVTALRPYLGTFKTKQMWFTHVYPYRRFDSILEIQNDYPYEIRIAHDDDVIEL